MKTLSGIRAVMCAAMCFIPMAEAQPFYTNLTNGSFESDLDDWTATGNVSVETTGNPAAPYTPTDGTKLAAFNAVNSPPNGILSRTLVVPNTILRKHRLRFDAGNLGFVAHDMKLNVRVVVDGTTRVDDDITVPGATGGATHWIACEYEFPTPLAGTVTLTFTDVSTNTEAADLLLDHVRVDDSRSISIHASDNTPNPGVPITVSPTDADRLGNGTTSFLRNYYAGDMITLTAPPSLGAGRAFMQWVRDGENLSTDSSISFAMADDVTMMAVYQPGIAVTPASGMALSIQGYVGTGPFTPLITDYQIRNESAGTIQWSAALVTPGTPWLSVWPRTGTLVPNESQQVKFLLTSAATTLNAGELHSHVRFTTTSSTLDVPVSILIHDPDKVAVNGSFESGFDSWTATGHVSLQNSLPYTATDGTSLVAFNAVNSTPDGVLKQTLHTEVGVRYFLDFDAGVLAYNTNEQRMRLRVRDEENAANPLLIDSVFPIFGTGGGSNVWTARHYEFIATSTLTEISFADESNFTANLDLLLDNVRVFNPAYQIAVTTSADENDPTLGLGSGDSLREALARAELVPGGNRITISSLVQIAPLPAALPVDSMVSIGTSGQTVTLHGYGFPGGLDVSAPTSIRNLILTGSTQSAIRNVSDLMLLDTQITENSSTGNGGGLLNTGAFVGITYLEGTLVADGCSFSHNHANQGGGLSAFGDVALTRCSLDGNTSDGNGGGLANNSAFGGNSIMLDACTVSRNTAGGSGGGYSGLTGYKSMGHMEAVNSTFSENSATTSGGGILTNGPVNLIHCTVSNNACASGLGGGIMETNAYGWVARLTQSIVAGNTAANDEDLSGSPPVLNGGNLITGDPQLSPLGHNGGSTETMPPTPSSPAVDAALTILETPALDQRGNARVSGLYADFGAVELKQIVVNTLADEDDGIGNNGVSLRDAVAENKNNPVDLIRFASSLNGGNIHLAHGPIIAFAGPEVHLDAGNLPAGITVSGDSLSYIFGFVFNNGSLRGMTLVDSVGYAVDVFIGGVDFADCKFRNNQGAIVVGHYGAGAANISRCVFENNSTDGSGGAIFNDATVRVADSTFTNNHAEASGGAIACSDHLYGLSVTNSTFTGNTAAHGAAIQADCLTLVHSTLSGNHASVSGGGILSTYGTPRPLDPPELGIRLSNSIIAGNTAPSSPDIAGSVQEHTGNNFIGGDPKLSPLADYGGPTPTMPPQAGSPAVDAALLLESTPATDQRGNARVSGSAADLGAVELKQLIVNTLADENDGITTGGVSLRDAVSANTSEQIGLIRFAPGLNAGTITLVHGPMVIVGDPSLNVDASTLAGGITVSGNQQSAVFQFLFSNVALKGLTIAESSGSAVESSTGYLSLEDCVFHDNHATADGGALVLEDSFNGSASIERCLFERNTATGRGGAIYNNSIATISDSTFSNNQSVGNGGAVFTGIYRVGLRLDNSTFTGNTASNGGAIAAGSLKLVHSTLSGNQATSAGGGLFSTSTIPNPELGLSISNSIIAGNFAPAAPDISGPVDGQFGTNMIGGNPKLAPLADYGGPTPTMPPLPGSPAIEGAVLLDSTPVADQRGTARPLGLQPDIGAVEAFALSTLSLIDTDQDGIDDRLEPAYGLVVGTDDSGTDSDGDGSQDAEEIANMTDPANPMSFLRILSFARVGAGPTFRVIFPSFPGLSYSAECAPNLDFQGPNARVIPLGAATSTTTQADIELMPGRDFVRIRRDP